MLDQRLNLKARRATEVSKIRQHMMKWYSGNQGKAKQSCDLSSIALQDYEFL